MQVLVNIMLDSADTLAMTPDEVAAAVLQALGGDETDTVKASVQQMPETGIAGLDVHALARAEQEELQAELARQPPPEPPTR